MPDNTSPIAWIDVETTGLDPEFCDLLEIAAVVTTGPDYAPVDEGIAVSIHPQQFAHLSPADAVTALQKHLMVQALKGGDQGANIVNAMHVDSGLFDEIAAGKCVSLAEADHMVQRYLAEHVHKREAIMGGNSITLDRNFLQKYAPKTYQHLHYRSLDCTSVYELVRRLPWMGDDYALKAEAPGTPHRAMADVLTSIEQARLLSAVLAERDSAEPVDTSA